MSSESVLQTIKKGKVTMQSEVGEEILYELTTDCKFLFDVLYLSTCQSYFSKTT